MVSIGEALIAMELLGIGAAALLWKDPAAVQAQVAVQGPKRPPGAPGLPPTFPRPPGGPPLPPRPSEDTGAGTGLNNRGPRPLSAPPLRPPDDAPDDFAFRNPLFSRGPRQPRAPGQPLQPLQPLQPRAPLQPLQPRAPLQPLQPLQPRPPQPPQPPRPPVDEAARLELERAVNAIHPNLDVSSDAQGNPQVLVGPIGSQKVWKIVKTGDRIQFRNPDTNQLLDRIPPSPEQAEAERAAAAQAAAAQAAAAQAAAAQAAAAQAAAQAEADRVAAAQAEAERVAAAQAEAERVAAAQAAAAQAAAAQAAAAQAAAAQAAAAQAAEQAAAAQAAAQPAPAPAPAEPALQVVTNPLANLRRPPPSLPGQVDVDSGGEGGDEGSVVVNPLRSARVPAPRSGVPPLPGASVRNPLHNISEYLNGRGDFIARYVTSVETNNEREKELLLQNVLENDSAEEKQALASGIWGAVQRKSSAIKQRIADDLERLDPGTYSLYSSSASDSASASDVGNASSVPSTPFPAGPPPTPAAPAAPADELPVVNEEVEAGEEEEEEEAVAPRRRPKPLQPRQVPLGFNPNAFARSRRPSSSTPTLNVDYRGNFGNTNALAARRGDTAEQILSQTRGAQLQRDIANASPLGFLQRLQRTNANRLTTGRATYGGRRRGKGRKSTFRKKRKGGK